MLVALVPIMVLSEEPRLAWVSDVLALLLLACLIGSAVHQIRIGKLYPMAAGRKRRERWILVAMVFSPIAVAIALRVFH